MDAGVARARLEAAIHGVLCTLHPERGPDPQPVVYAVTEAGATLAERPSDEEATLAEQPCFGYVGVPIDSVKPKASTRLKREDNLAADPRGTLLIEHWETEDWSRLWWVRADLRHMPDPPPALVDDLAQRLARTVRQYADRPFHRVLVCRIVAVTGWSAAE